MLLLVKYNVLQTNIINKISFNLIIIFLFYNKVILITAVHNYFYHCNCCSNHNTNKILSSTFSIIYYILKKITNFNIKHLVTKKAFTFAL